MAIEKSMASSSLAEVVDRILDKGVVVDAWVRVSLVGIEILAVEARVTVAGKEVKLTPTEYNLLQELVLNAGRVLTHTYLLNKVWGLEYREEREYLHVFVRRLRAKIEPDPINPRYIMTLPGVGYRFIDRP